MTSIPIQSGCDPAEPREHVAWALVGLAGPSAHAPLILPTGVIAAWSEHLWNAGFRHHPDLQTIKYVPPPAGTNWVAGAAGQWLPMDAPLSPEQSAPDISHLSDEEKLVLWERIKSDLGHGNSELTDDDHAEVTYGES